jgi:hypothetical protein
MVKSTTWDEKFAYETTLQILTDLALSHLDDVVATPDLLLSGVCEASKAAEEIRAFITRRSFSNLCDFELDYNCGISATNLIHLRQALACFQKLEDLDLGVDKEAVARKKFEASEQSCLKTNIKFCKWSSGEFQFPAAVEAVLHGAMRKISKCLGDVPSLSEMELRFGPGATTSVKRRKACDREKLSQVPSCSADLLPLVPAILSQLPGYTGLHTVDSYVDGEFEVDLVNVELHDAVLDFAPKNAKTYRTICKQPTLNMMYQLGLGDQMANRLLGVGQDIRDQARNQRLAREGSLTGALATLDLSAASDSISIELVAHLLPIEWYSALSLGRTSILSDRGKLYRFQQFSSMGNGYTFPLETLIFWGLMMATAEYLGSSTDQINVYGDDIIVPVDVVPLAREVLEQVGFKLNLEKSFWSGGFRESCGTDYFCGINIRPYYVKELLSFADLFRVHNEYVRRFDLERARLVLAHIPPTFRIYGPDGYGDGHLLGDHRRLIHKAKEGWAGYIFDTFVLIGNRSKRPQPGDRVLPVYSVYVRNRGRRADETSYHGYFKNYDALYLKQHALDFEAGSGCTPHKTINKSRDEYVPVLSLPGTKGYKRISIYTLAIT